MKLVPVCSGKGGVGRSCVCAYTAAALASMGKKTLLIECGGPIGSLDVILGVQDAVIFNLHDVLGGVCEPKKAILPVPRRENLFLLPTGLFPQKIGESISFAELIRALRHDYDFILVDDPDFKDIDLAKTSAVLLVTTPDTLSVRAAAQKLRELCDAGANNVRLVVNNVPARVVPMRSFSDFDEIIDQIGAQLIAVIPASQKLHHSANNGLPLSPDSITLQVFKRLACRVRGKHEPLLIR